jgi:hypothetical protein
MEFESLLGKIVRVETERHELPLFGRLLHATSGYLTIERRNGLVVIIRADQWLQLPQLIGSRRVHEHVQSGTLSIGKSKRCR